MKVDEKPIVISSLCGAKYGAEFSLDEVRGLIGFGLFEMSYEPLDVVVSETDDCKILLDGGSKYSTTTHGGVLVFISSAGEIILKVFSKNYASPDPLKHYLRSVKKCFDLKGTVDTKDSQLGVFCILLVLALKGAASWRKLELCLKNYRMKQFIFQCWFSLLFLIRIWRTGRVLALYQQKLL